MAGMAEPATVSIWALIDFFPRAHDTGWRCMICPQSTPPDPPGTNIADSPRWNVGPGDEWAQREARNHLAELHNINFVKHY